MDSFAEWLVIVITSVAFGRWQKSDSAMFFAWGVLFLWKIS